MQTSNNYLMRYCDTSATRSLTVKRVRATPSLLYSVVTATVHSSHVSSHRLASLLRVSDRVSDPVSDPVSDSASDAVSVSRHLTFDSCIPLTHSLTHSLDHDTTETDTEDTVHTVDSPSYECVCECVSECVCECELPLLSYTDVQNLRELLFSLPISDLLPTTPSLTHTPTPTPPLLISIEGNVGAGKSSLLELLRAKHPEWVFIEEPVHFWESLRNKKGQSLFELYYEDKSRWAYTFQNCAVLSRYQGIETAIAEHQRHHHHHHQGDKRQVFITERCLSSDHEVFAKMLHHDRKIDTLEYALYQKWLDQLLKSSTTLGAVIHVNTPADICAARVKSRHRGGEEDIPLEYLKAVGQYQQAWVDGLAQTLPGCPVHTTGYTPIDSVAEVEEFVRSLQSL